MDVPDGWHGRVTERVYKGTFMSYLIDLDDGTEINADVAHDDASHRHNVGDELTVSFRPEDVVLIPDNTTGA
jgi:ABC-type Fe3+/spermidine/putrescine transport system ATPase subunit